MRAVIKPPHTKPLSNRQRTESVAKRSYFVILGFAWIWSHKNAKANRDYMWLDSPRKQLSLRIRMIQPAPLRLRPGHGFYVWRLFTRLRSVPTKTPQRCNDTSCPIPNNTKENSCNTVSTGDTHILWIYVGTYFIQKRRYLGTRVKYIIWLGLPRPTRRNVNLLKKNQHIPYSV